MMQNKTSELNSLKLKTEDIEAKIKFYEAEMKKAAKEFRFEEAAEFRDCLRKYQQLELED
jgi:excinuclease ABC subunit B